MSSVGVIVLAAGGSRRMGQPKQLLGWSGKTLLRHAAEAALATTCRPVVVVLGAEASRCRLELEGLDLHLTENVDWKQGLGRSVAVGVTALEALAPEIKGALLLLVDQPTVTTAHLQALITAWSQDCAIAATCYPEGGGVPAIFSQSYFPDLRHLAGDQGARAIIARHTKQVTLIEPNKPIPDLDTMQSYQESLANLDQTH